MLFAGQHDELRVQHLPTMPMQPVGGALKRVLDFVVALAAFLLLLPLLAIVALLVLATMGRPILCRRVRVGFGGRAIGCYRFRTTKTLAGQDRLTPLGELLRRSGIDKLPQLLNVLKGEMSFVGPRPLAPDELQRYASEDGPYLQTRPGMTGTWQLAPDEPSCAEMAALDSAYVHNWSMQGDIVILLKTIPAVVGAEDRA